MEIMSMPCWLAVDDFSAALLLSCHAVLTTARLAASAALAASVNVAFVVASKILWNLVR